MATTKGDAKQGVSFSTACLGTRRVGDVERERMEEQEQEQELPAARPRTKHDASKQASNQANQISQPSKRWHKTHNVIAAVG